ncbi:RNA methyltransferase [Chitinibacter bivalviorum]|uniref:RNA methyltransferase n=1 Tax=Chitinibacter bivalviorum TaxID=2739434 RepID=A0A7H9BHX9_9NEIS|nr:RNA methyltransferase [Chitinibacter bivalviorum]QLG87876.1 RNA methyltransferase [Chitinibacter bivalviorum]
MKEIISSSSNPQYKLAFKISQTKRERTKQGLALLDGVHLVRAWLDAGREIETVLFTEAGAEKSEIEHLLQQIQAKTLCISEALFSTLSELPSATGLLAIVKIPTPPAAKVDGFCLLLDGVQDPGNVGAILRTAFAAGVQQVWLSAQCADIWSPKVLRAGMGAQVVLPCIENADLVSLAQSFKGQVVASLLDEAASDLYQTDLRGDIAFVMGSEGQGVSPEMAAMAKTKVLIPMQAGIESLNVGHASAIALYEVMRQNR